MPKIVDFYPILLTEARLSKDPHRKVCAVAFDKHLNRLASGWNGCPRGVEDKPERYERPLKDWYVKHAEENLVASAARLGIALDGSSMLITEWQPCAGCAGLLVQAGIKHVWAPIEPTSGKTVRTEWIENFHHAANILKEGRVELHLFTTRVI